MENKVIKFEFTVEQTNVILTIMQEAPFKIAKPVIDTILTQAESQMNETPTTEEPKAKMKSVK